MSENLAIHRFL